MKVWKIEDGDIHYVWAASAEDAITLVAAHAGVTGSEYEADAVRELTQECADGINVLDEDESAYTTVGAMARAATGPEYLCGSVW